MRAYLWSALLGVTALGGCKWSDFDDLGDKTWVHSTDKPSIGSTDYAKAILGVTSSSSGGQLAVISNDAPNYSTLDYTATGSADVGPNNQPLGHHFIASLSDPPILITDGMGKVALVERAIDAGNIAVVVGPASAVADTPFSSPNTPDAATFAGQSLIIAAGPTFYTLAGMGIPPSCTSSDPMFKASALASDGTTLFVWTQTGVFGSLPVSALSPCTSLPAFTGSVTTGLMPAIGSQIHLVGKYAILAGHPGASTAGQVIVVDTSTMMQVGTPLMVEGLKSSTVGDFGGEPHLALGVPSRTVEGLVSGQVDVYAIDTNTGALGSPVLTLNDAQPESNQEFGRSVTTMKFNGEEILVIGAHSEIFAYYKTALYDHLPAQ